jgi:ubiquinone/menaquinone biosynthesis C-methylase UbiE
MDEVRRIREWYAEWTKNSMWTPFNTSALYLEQMQERLIINLWKEKYNIGPRLKDSAILRDKRILDVGCGTGGTLRKFIKYGTVPENLSDIDLIEERIETAKHLSPNINFICGNAEYLPYPNDYFEIVIQFTCFSSIIDKSLQENIAREMLRVLKPGGYIIWYDIRKMKSNPNMMAIDKNRILELFPNCQYDLKLCNTTISSISIKVSWILTEILEILPLPKSHLFGVITKEE